MEEDNLDGYRQANQELYDRTVEQFRTACQEHSRSWQKELKERMKLLDYRFKMLGEE